MTRLSLIAAAFGVALAGAAPAAAQQTIVTKRTVVHSGPAHRAQTRRVCRVERHHGHRTRICRTVRYR